MDPTKCSFWLSVIQTSFTGCSYYFGSTTGQEKKNKSRPKNQYRWVHELSQDLFFQERGSTGIKSGNKTTTALVEHHFQIKEARGTPWKMNYNELLRTQRNSQTLMRIWGMGRQKLTATNLLRRVAAVLWIDSGWCSGRGWGRRGALRRRSSSGRGHERKKMLERGRMRKDRSCLFIRKDS